MPNNLLEGGGLFLNTPLNIAPRGKMSAQRREKVAEGYPGEWGKHQGKSPYCGNFVGVESQKVVEHKGFLGGYWVRVEIPHI